MFRIQFNLQKLVFHTFRTQKNILCSQHISTIQTKPENVSIMPDSGVWSWNEWDPLEEIIVGITDEATIPELLPEVKACVSPNQWEMYEKNAGRLWADCIPKEHWDKIEKNVANLVRVLEAEGVRVVRPIKADFRKRYSTPMFETSGLYAAMPRDIILVVGDEIFESPMCWRSRYFENISYRPLLLKYWREGSKWTTPPKPLCGSDLIDENYEVKDEVTRSKLAMENRFVTTEVEPCFDAADFLRAGQDIFGQRSQVTNLLGIDWLRRHLAPRGIHVHKLTFNDPRPMHIDATFALIKPGLALQNPDRPCNQIDYITAAGWKVVNCPQPKMSDDHPLWLGSKWLSMNTLMLDENRILVEEEETDLQEMFQNHGLKTIPVNMRHANSIGGGFHCWTTDTRRRGRLQSYFDWSKMGFPPI